MLAVLAAADVVLRVFEERLSLDLRHINQASALISKLHASSPPRILFIGNSLTRGVLPDMLADILAEHGVPRPSVARVYPDDSTVATWSYLFKNRVARPGQEPDLLVINCTSIHLDDAAPYHISRLGRHWTGLADLPELLGRELTSLDQTMDYLAASLSAAYAQRRRVSLAVLSKVIPGYRSAVRRIRKVAEAQPTRGNATPIADDAGNVMTSSEVTYSRLERLLQCADEHGVHVAIITMPAGGEYPVPSGLPETIREAGMTFLDLRDIPGIGPDSYSDGYHLNEAGKVIYTQALGEALVPVVRSIQDGSATHPAEGHPAEGHPAEG